MSKKVRMVIVEVPHRISGFFEIVDELNGVKISVPEQIGSRGAGFNLSAVGRTEIKGELLERDEISKCKIYINGEKLNKSAETTYFIFENIIKKLDFPIKLEIHHNFELPVGCGYGASGSGALGIIYGIDDLLNLNLSEVEKGRIAHVSEVVNRTGLGTVCGQLTGGLSVLKDPGYPCKCEKISFPKDLLIVCGSFGMIHTKSILTDPDLSMKIKRAGKKALIRLINNPDINTFVKVSIEFVRETNMISLLSLFEVDELIKDLNKLDIIGASMNQLGKSVYAICKIKNKKDVFNVFNAYLPRKKIYFLRINDSGPKIIKGAQNYE
jgi:pantoate kinase